MRAFSILSAVLISTPLFAASADVIRDKDSFLAELGGRDLTISMFDLALKVHPDGKLSGTAMGWGVTGSWVWKDGLFCRDMDWSGYKIDYECQQVEKNGSKLRFVSNAGKGRAADFRLK